MPKGDTAGSWTSEAALPVGLPVQTMMIKKMMTRNQRRTRGSSVIETHRSSIRALAAAASSPRVRGQDGLGQQTEQSRQIAVRRSAETATLPSTDGLN